MGINFRKRIKILPGVNLNISKSGISTTIGPKGANVNIGKKGAFLNTGIPGTGIYSRSKIGASTRNNKNSNYKSYSNNNYMITQKSKSTTIVLAFFLGTIGIHRFYLGQYWKGIFSVLFCWTFIPTIISIIDCVVFSLMTTEKFDDKYNNYLATNQQSNVQNCSGCSTLLTFMTTPNLGGGKLTDGGRVCRNCFSKIIKCDAGFGLNSSNTYDTENVLQILNKPYSLTSSVENKKINFENNVTNITKSKEFSIQFYSLLKDFSNSLYRVVKKLKTDKDILDRVNAGNLDVSSEQYITNCVIYDMIQISVILAKGDLSSKSLEAAGLVLATNQLLPNNSNNMLERDHSFLSQAFKNGVYTEIAESLLEIAETPNPLDITIKDNQENIQNSAYKITNNLSFPTLLKITDNSLFDEYVTTLYRYACIISKADDLVSKEEQEILNEIYQILHHPIAEKKNDSLQISKSNKTETLNDVLDELNALTGLEEVKAEINTLINFIKVQKAREESGLKSSTLSYHIVFTGNPGTGKTTVARIVAKIYKHLGILSEGQLVETDRSGLVAEFTGQTAVKVNKSVNSALNGILFIDEAYSLVGENKDDFGKEAVATLIKRMEDDRDKLVLILAGYTKEMSNFIDVNPGFKSRFNRYINFPDYTPDELLKIFESKCKSLEYSLTENAISKLKTYLDKAYSERVKSFGNGRFVRNVFEKTIENQSNRIAKESNFTKELMITITEDDISII